MELYTVSSKLVSLPSSSSLFPEGRRFPRFPQIAFPYHRFALSTTSSSSDTRLHLPARTRTCIVRCLAEGGEEEIVTPDGYFPEANFYKVEAVLRPWRLSHVTTALLRAGIRGATVSDVRGLGAQGGARERQAGSEFGEDSFVSKVKLEVVISKDQVDAVINTIIDQARTGEIGDGKIFVVPVADVIRVRTGERGLKGERMAGGRAEILLGSNGNTLN